MSASLSRGAAWPAEYFQYFSVFIQLSSDLENVTIWFSGSARIGPSSDFLLKTDSVLQRRQSRNKCHHWLVLREKQQHQACIPNGYPHLKKTYSPLG